MVDEYCCSHSKVELKHIGYPDGTRSDYWVCCAGCGQKFIPEPAEPVKLKQSPRYSRDCLNAMVAYELCRLAKELLHEIEDVPTPMTLLGKWNKDKTQCYTILMNMAPKPAQYMAAIWYSNGEVKELGPWRDTMEQAQKDIPRDENS